MAHLVLSLLAASSIVKRTFASPHGWLHPNPDDYSHPSNGICTDYTAAETVTSNQFVWGIPKFENNFDVAGFLFEVARKDAKAQPLPFSGTKNVTATYKVAGTFCTPKEKKAGKENTVLLATHGLGYDRRYWASSFQPKNYSFVDYVLANGYSVFYYDRLGTGKSQILSGYENQAANQIAVIGALAQSIRAGKYTADVKADKIVLVGHSFGSSTSNALLAAQPDVVDGAILTGFSLPNATDPAGNSGQWIPSAFALRIASTESPKSALLDTGYLGFGDIYAHVETFFHKPDYDIDAAKYAQSISNPLAIAELISLATLKLAAPNFKGKVLITDGEFDLIFCGGECKSTYDGGLQQQVFPAAQVLETYVHPGAGHGVNFGKNATGFYGEIVSFLDRNF